ncbi:hypothetical protein AXFE_13210 [Acidithrix ferrooxidans]|uniref:Uncharacterized protein n=1 Tax=Acidithrix ferrooxidans TaxID=1280514 RepID=A0A0D8HIZ0_9ACTN|nr:hypothetical protein AXFE_13210 [Acidithrix ferrooxidans]
MICDLSHWCVYWFSVKRKEIHRPCESNLGEFGQCSGDFQALAFSGWGKSRRRIAPPSSFNLLYLYRLCWSLLKSFLFALDEIYPGRLAVLRILIPKGHGPWSGMSAARGISLRHN